MADGRREPPTPRGGFSPETCNGSTRSTNSRGLATASGISVRRTPTFFPLTVRRNGQLTSTHIPSRSPNVQQRSNRNNRNFFQNQSNGRGRSYFPSSNQSLDSDILTGLSNLSSTDHNENRNVRNNEPGQNPGSSSGETASFQFPHFFNLPSYPSFSMDRSEAFPDKPLLPDHFPFSFYTGGPANSPTPTSSNLGVPNNPVNTFTAPKHTETASSNFGSQEGPSNNGICSVSELSWVNAPEFIPKNIPKTYTQAVAETPNQIMCPSFISKGICNSIDICVFKHGDRCDICNRDLLHPTNDELRNQHEHKCRTRKERAVEISIARQRSKGKTCGICMEVVIEKQECQGRFGILAECNHCYCLDCIRKWRQAKQFENNVVRACPECRITSDFVCPSLFWVDTKEEKKKLISNYKMVLSEKHCKYFKRGAGRCPFGNKCFYLHALPDGSKTDVGPPLRRRRPRFYNDEQDFDDILQQIIFWEIHDDAEHHWLYTFANDLEDVVTFFSDSDESEWSEFDYFLE